VPAGGCSRRNVRPANCSATSHPLGRPIGQLLSFPDRHLRLDLVDERPACFKSFLPMFRGNRDRDGDIADRQIAQAVFNGHRPNAVGSRNPFSDLPHHPCRVRMGFVPQGDDRMTMVVVAHHAEESRHPTGGPIGNESDQRVDVDRFGGKTTPLDRTFGAFVTKKHPWRVRRRVAPDHTDRERAEPSSNVYG